MLKGSGVLNQHKQDNYLNNNYAAAPGDFIFATGTVLGLDGKWQGQGLSPMKFAIVIKI